MGFSDFVGNADVVNSMRTMLLRGRLPHAVILAGAEGSGKYTLAQMVAKTVHCQKKPSGIPDFCGECEACVQIAMADDLAARFSDAVDTREAMRETDKKETRILIQTHPNILIVPPDPPQMMIKVDQVRRVTETIYFRPASGGRRIYIFTESNFMKEAANALLKVLEEPPEFATLFLLTRNPGELIPTIRSRCITFHLAPLPAPELERVLARVQSELKPAQRELISRLCGGAYGRARRFDLTAYIAARTEALAILNAAVSNSDHSAQFRVTEAYRAGADGRDKTQQLLRATYLVLQDLLYLRSGTPELVRNTDALRELERISHATDFGWITRAARELSDVESGMRRNLLRSLSLDAFAAALEN